MPIRFTEELLGSSRGHPPLGCRYCDRGAKMVLYITGICRQKCFYCPLSEEKKARDVIYANERKVEGEDWLEQVLDEARRMRALGTGITGGDPLVVPDRTIEVIKTLKKEFGRRHHIHLYTTGPFEKKVLKELKEAGLDEIRYHPPIHVWSDFRKDLGDGSASPYHEIIMEAVRVGLVTGLEIPAVVDEDGDARSRRLKDLASYAIEQGLSFVNINELEASHTNMASFKEMGYELVGDSMAVKGSSRLALDVMDEMGMRYPDTRTVLHFCTSVYKDSIQLRHRLIRMAKNLRKPYDIITDDGTLLRGVIEVGDPSEQRDDLIARYGIPDDLVEQGESMLFIAPWILEEIAPDLKWDCYISEVYPTWDHLEVERIPMG